MTNSLENNEKMAEPKLVLTTKEEVINRLKQLTCADENINKQELDNLKQLFFKIHNSEQEAAKVAFIENGGKEEDFVPSADPLEKDFKDFMAVLKEKKNEEAAKLQKLMEDNKQVKIAIIEEIKELLEKPDDAMKSYTEFKKLQQQWNETNPVPEISSKQLWRDYQNQIEKFYDIIKLNNEFRDYDFKKNLEIKTKICEAAEKLVNEEDVISAFHQLQKLHQDFRDTGPVAKELRDNIWARFKEASTLINRKHQQHFEQLKGEELHNLDAKTVICEIVESIKYEELKTFSNWKEKTDEVIALQNKWKTIGFAPKKLNKKIYERFRTSCDEFFKKKGEFFKGVKDEMSQNLEKKRILCEKAEAMKDSTDWKAGTDDFVRLQQEWKTIGPVARKNSDTIWKRFITACDFFFEQKNKTLHSERFVETENLEKKKGLLTQLSKIDLSTEREAIIKTIQNIMNEWNTIGHVPFKEKDKIYDQYHQTIDNLYKELNIGSSEKSLNNLKADVNNIAVRHSSSLYKEHERLTRAHDAMKAELNTYENNLGFLTSSSKKGSTLLTEINNKANKLRADLEVIRQKIDTVNKSINDKKEGI